MKVLGIMLVLFGIVALVYGGVGYDKKHTVLDVGGIKATTTEHEGVPVPPIIGGIAFLVGALLLISTRKRLA